MTTEKTELQKVKKPIKKSYNKKYIVKQVYHLNHESLNKLLKIASKTNRSYNAIMNELCEKFVSQNEKLLISK